MKKIRSVGCSVGVLAAMALAACSGSNSAPVAQFTDPKTGPLRFTDVTQDAGLVYTHTIMGTPPNMPTQIAGGVACGDIDGDGWLDLFVVRGQTGTTIMFRNKGDGTFEDVTAASGTALSGESCGPAFADFDGDGDMDLLVCGVNDTAPRLLQNNGKGEFTDITKASGITTPARHTFSAAFGDIDGDGDLDLFMSHWRDRPKFRAAVAGHLWRNNGDSTFTDVSAASGILKTLFSRDGDVLDHTFTPNFADIDNDGDQDLLMCSDFGESRVYINKGDGTFDDKTDFGVITDENGMGSTVGDYDNDGDLDWFVSSVWLPPGNPPLADPGTGITGNRLYRNKGDGSFEDVTTAAGVREGYWGWAASFADLDNDGNLDIIHTNGFGRPQPGSNLSGDPTMQPFLRDPTRLFLSNGDGTFRNTDATVIDDKGQGRGLVCFDFDRDGDLDVFIANNDDEPVLYRNDGDKGNYLTVRLRGKSPNPDGIGARVQILIGARQQMRELRCGCNFVSQDPSEAHFGLGSVDVVDRVTIEWPDGTQTSLKDVPANQVLVVQR